MPQRMWKWLSKNSEMDEEKLIETVTSYMKNWMLLRCEENQIVILPSAGRSAGVYPEDFLGGTED